jgi:succinate dehydrogenase hydrophobic anchor subunit
MNFSNELSNDLAATKYVHPRNVDTKSPLHDLLSRTSFQVITFIVLAIYVNMLVSVLLPYSGGLYRAMFQAWPDLVLVKHFITGVLVQLFSLHFVIVLVRAMLLRKRITY